MLFLFSVTLALSKFTPLDLLVPKVLAVHCVWAAGPDPWGSVPLPSTPVVLGKLLQASVSLSVSQERLLVPLSEPSGSRVSSHQMLAFQNSDSCFIAGIFFCPRQGHLLITTSCCQHSCSSRPPVSGSAGNAALFSAHCVLQVLSTALPSF